MTGLIGAEWLKLRSVRSFWGYLAAVVVFAGIGTAGTVGSARASDRAAETFIPDLAGLATLSALIALVLGIVVVTGEFRHGTITPTFLATPHRERVQSRPPTCPNLLAPSKAVHKAGTWSVTKATYLGSAPIRRSLPSSAARLVNSDGSSVSADPESSTG